MKKEKNFREKETEEEISKESNENKQKSSESELEKEIEETEEIIDDNEFSEFIQPTIESFSPVLERIEIPQQESLEQDIASTPVSPNINQGQIDYSITSNEPNSAEERIKYQTNIEPPVLNPTEISANLPRQEFLEPMTRIEIPQHNINPKMVDTEFIEEKRRLPFEKDDKKYKEFRL